MHSFPNLKQAALAVKGSLRLFFDISVVSFFKFVFNDPLNFLS